MLVHKLSAQLMVISTQDADFIDIDDDHEGFDITDCGCLEGRGSTNNNLI